MTVRNITWQRIHPAFIGQKSSALVSRLAAPIGIEWQIHEKRLVSALRTGLTWANVTIDANATEYALVIVIIGNRVAKLLRVFQLAAK
jgi:hypothetical protein